MDYKEIKNKGLKELMELLAEKHDELRGLKFKASENQLKNVKQISKIRKEIAFLETALSAKKNEEKAKNNKQ